MGTENEMLENGTLENEDGLSELEQSLGIEPESESETEPETPPAGEQEKEKESEWNKEKQRADQAEANLRKIQQERQAMEARLVDAQKKAETLEAKLSEFAKANDIDLDEIDQDITDPKVVKALKVMKQQIEAANSRAAELEKVKESYEASERNKQIELQIEKSKAEIIEDIEQEFPAKFRNEALKMADEVCAKRGHSPADRYEAHKILRNCYKELAAKSKPAETKKTVPTDTGKGGGAIPEETLGTGSIRELAQKMKQKL